MLFYNFLKAFYFTFLGFDHLIGIDKRNNKTNLWKNTKKIIGKISNFEWEERGTKQINYETLFLIIFGQPRVQSSPTKQPRHVAYMDNHEQLPAR